MPVKLLLLIFLAAPPQGFSAMTPGEIDAFLAEAAKVDGLARLVKISGMFLQVPYADSPLGEGKGNAPDEDPLIRFDAADCTTFLETSMAMARASSLKEALEVLRQIRYIDGQIDYRRRKHFMMAQWIPLNQKAGFIQDITEQVGGDSVSTAAKRLNAEVWKRRRPKDSWPELDPEDVPEGIFKLPIIPINRARELIDEIPAGTIVNVVRVDYRSMPVRVTHQGLVVVRRGKRYLRHAARAGYRRVVDELLETFLRRNSAYKKWPVAGINLQKIM
jgi:D-alanyl-D-alanine carboxypeptidase/D-alanyl-D-alanine-endopeptidase (penicillin-binding protein 4)